MSSGCEHCYAEAIAARFSKPGQPYEGLARRRSNGQPAWTGELRFLPAHRAWLKEIEDSVEPDARWSSKGFLAGWLAEKIRLGEGAGAWAELYGRWNFAEDEGEEACPNGDDPDACAKKDRKVLKFPERLRLFLTDADYKF